MGNLLIDLTSLASNLSRVKKKMYVKATSLKNFILNSYIGIVVTTKKLFLFSGISSENEKCQYCDMSDLTK